MSQNEIEEVELSIETARRMVERGKKAERLAENPDFKDLVLDGYFVEEAARLALLSSDPMAEPQVREAILRDLNGPGAFKRYMHTIVMLGQHAEREIEEAQYTLEELRDEEIGE